MSPETPRDPGEALRTGPELYGAWTWARKIRRPDGVEVWSNAEVSSFFGVTLTSEVTNLGGVTNYVYKFDETLPTSVA